MSDILAALSGAQTPETALPKAEPLRAPVTEAPELLWLFFLYPIATLLRIAFHLKVGIHCSIERIKNNTA